MDVAYLRLKYGICFFITTARKLDAMRIFFYKTKSARGNETHFRLGWGQEEMQYVCLDSYIESMVAYAF